MRRLILLIFMVALTTMSHSKSAKSWVHELDLVDISALNSKDVSSFGMQKGMQIQTTIHSCKPFKKIRRVYCLPKQTSENFFILHIQTETISLSATALLMQSVTVLNGTYI